MLGLPDGDPSGTEGWRILTKAMNLNSDEPKL